MIRRRLVAGVTAVAALCILAGGVVTMYALEERLISNLDRDFRASNLSREVREVVQRPRPNFQPPADQFDPVRRVAVVRYDRGGRPVQALPSGSERAPDPLPDAAGLSPADGIVTVSSDGGPRYRAAAIDVRNGTVVLAASMAGVDQTLRDTRRTLLVWGSIATGAIAVLSLLVIRRAFRPVEGMIASADQIAGGDLSARTGVLHDGSEVGRLGQALDTMLDRIQDASDAKDASEERLRRFLADASHELRTPLTSVRGYAELYRKGETDDADVRTAMTRIEAEATRMGRLVEQLLLLARLDEFQETRAPHDSDVDLSALVGAAVDAARVVDGARRYDLALPAPPTPRCRGDADQLRQLVDNLLANTRLHTPPGTTVNVQLRADGNAGVLVIEDDGPGFADDERDRAFDRFWQSPRTINGGSGLGLSIVHGIVHGHSGSVDIGASAAGGARITVRLPLLGNSGGEAGRSTTP